MLRRKTPLKPGGPIKKRRKRKMSELTPREREKRREKWAFDRKLKEVDKLSRELAYLIWGDFCKWPLCKGGTNVIQWHHYITRDIWSVRWDPDNLIPLHDKCHNWGIHGKHSHYGVDMQIARLGRERFEALTLKKNTDTLPRTMETLEEKEEELKLEIIRVSNSL